VRASRDVPRCCGVMVDVDAVEVMDETEEIDKGGYPG
jgi:hypothetical protein